MYRSLASLLVLAALFSAGNGIAKDKAKKEPDLVKLCKKDCPEAKNNKEAHECVEDRAKAADGEAFKKSKCWTENERYENMVGG